MYITPLNQHSSGILLTEDMQHYIEQNENQSHLRIYFKQDSLCHKNTLYEINIRRRHINDYDKGSSQTFLEAK